MAKFIFTIIFFTYLPFAFSQEKSNWTFEAHGGYPLNIPLPLSIHQNGYPDIKLTAQFDSEPFVLPIYWVYRISKWKNNKAWEFEMMHQKLYLQNKPPEVEYFNISHGYNLIMFNRAFKFQFLQKHQIIARTGLGFVLPHAENKVRGKKLDQGEGYFSGYVIGGPAINLALAKQFKITNRFYFNAEIKNNTSFAKVPIVDGHAIVWHSAFEIIGGIGVYIIKNE